MTNQPLTTEQLADIGRDACLRGVARRINESMNPGLEVGMVCTASDGKTVVRIMDGTYLDAVYHRVSNHWTWRPVLQDGTLGEEQHGYGWRPKEIYEHEETVHVRVTGIKQ